MARFRATTSRWLLAFAAASIVPVCASEAGQAAPKGTVERIVVHGRALEGNLEGDSPDRAVVVYLPPSYSTERSRRYPVLYFLHGYGVGAETYVRALGIPESIDRAISAGSREMIVVLPDAFTKYSGSMYSNSPTIGDWETFVAHDVTAAIDAKYRTVATRGARGLAGHSMGGYGTMRVGMKRPDAFVALYAMSSCCLMNDPAGRGAGPRRGDAPGRGNAPAPEGRGAPPAGRGGVLANALSAQAAAWAPNVHNPPDYFDLPTKDGEIQQPIAAQWMANSPLVMIGQYAPALKTMRAVALDVGDQDPFVTTNRQLADALTRVDVAQTLEVYEGDHMNHIRDRFELKVLPFFSRQLGATAGQ
jgi:enterochelin esterase-like enzyme